MKLMVRLSILILIFTTMVQTMPPDSLTNARSKEILELLQPLSQEHLNVIMLYKVTQGSLPPDSQTFQQFIQTNHLNIDVRYWDYCKISMREGLCDIQINIDKAHPCPRKMADSSIIVRAVAVIRVKDVMKGQKSSIVGLSRGLVIATIKHTTTAPDTLNSFLDSSYMVFSRLSEETAIRLAKNH
jgi:hypothetical protein